MKSYDALRGDFHAPGGPDEIAPISDGTMAYIADGHAHGAGLGKSEFLKEWTGDVLREKLQQVIDDPQAIRPDDEGRPNRVRLHGLVDGVQIRVVVEDSGKGWVPWSVVTSYPDGGSIL